VVTTAQPVGVTDGRQVVSYSLIDVKDFEGRRTPVAQALGAAAIKANQFDSQPDQAGHEHDELKTGQEELYVPLRGSGSLQIDGETVELTPGFRVIVGVATPAPCLGSTAAGLGLPPITSCAPTPRPASASRSLFVRTSGMRCRPLRLSACTCLRSRRSSA
jgi:quercetin dioxygenase-like cupin family protein